MTPLFYLLLAAYAVGSYLLGGVNGAILMSGLVYHEDIRTKGSGNPGFTNFKRVYGMNAATVAAMSIDVLKAVIPALSAAILFRYVSGGDGWLYWQLGAAYAGLFCMLGHAFPLWYGFKGGKAFLTFATTIWFIDWRMALIVMGLFLILLTTVRYMSLASMTAAFTCPVVILIFTLTGQSSWYTLALTVCYAILIIARHHANISRLLHGTESRFSFGTKKQL